MIIDYLIAKLCIKHFRFVFLLFIDANMIYLVSFSGFGPLTP